MNENCLIIENECELIPSREIRHLFEPFYRPDFSRGRKNGGNGLGLYIVDTLLTVNSPSKNGQGTPRPPHYPSSGGSIASTDFKKSGRTLKMTVQIKLQFVLS